MEEHKDVEIIWKPVETIWCDEKALIPYYEAIRVIRAGLDICCLPLKSGFHSWPTPNPFFCRTPRYLFLETISEGVDKHNERLSCLYTPFGEVKLLGSGFVHRMVEWTKSFMWVMTDKWEIEELTGIAPIHYYLKGTTCHVGTHKRYCIESGIHYSLYMIKSVGINVLASKNANDEYEHEVILYQSGICLNDGQYEIDRQMFKKISNESDMF